MWAKKAFCVPARALWIAPLVTGKLVVESVDPVSTAPFAVSTAIAKPLSVPLPPKYEKYVELTFPEEGLLSLATNASVPPAFALWKGRVPVGIVKLLEVV